MPRSANQKPLALPRRGQQGRAFGTTMPVIAVCRQRLAKPQQQYPSRVGSVISTTSQRRKAAPARRHRRLLCININQRSNSQYDSRVINRGISTATATNDYPRRLARQQRQHIRVGNSCMLAATRKAKALLTQLYINSDQQS